MASVNVYYKYEKENFGVHSVCFLKINIIYPTYTVSLLDWAIILDTFLPSKHSNTDAIFPTVTSLNISSYLLGKFSTLSIRRTLRLLGLVSSCQTQLRVFSCCDKSGELNNFWILAQLWFYEYLIDITWEPVQITQCICCFQYFPWM